MECSDGARTRPRKTDIAYERLKELLITLQLPPGTTIDERALMRRLALGRTPLREAIQRLSHEGLIVHVPRRGNWVAPLSITDLQHLLEARRLVEPPAACLAASRITPEEIAQLRAVLERADHLVETGNNAECVLLDQTFHRLIAAATRNPVIARMVEQVNQELLRYWYVSFVWVGSLGPTFAHHHRIVEALARRDSEQVERLMHQHIDLFRERIRGMIGIEAPPDGTLRSTTFAPLRGAGTTQR